MAKKITLYSSPNCPWCVLAKRYLTEKNVKFTEYDVGEEPDKYEEMINLSRQTGVPVITVDDEVIIGFNKQLLEKML